LFSPQLAFVAAVEIETAEEAVMVKDEVAEQLTSLVIVTT
jgi:hypothetical protein